MDKTVVVAVEDRVKHALYGKVIRRTNKLKAHDEQNAAGVGDRVLLMETRPLSATQALAHRRDPREGQVSILQGNPAGSVPPGSAGAQLVGVEAPAGNRQTNRR